MRTKSRRSGFTLPEVLVTVTVVAVLAAVVVPAVTQFAGRGDAPSTASDINAIRTAVTSYVADQRKVPTSLSDLTAYASVLTFSSTATTATYTSKTGYGLQLGNDISSGNDALGTTYIVLIVKGSSQSCQAIDKGIDDGDGSTDGGSTTGNFRYSSNATSCTTGKILLMPRPTL